MGSKPKKTEAGASEKASSQVATAQYARFKEKYLPEMLAERDRTTNVDQRDYFRGKAQADTMQGLTGSGNTTIASIGAVDTTADRASSAGQQLLQADVQGATNQAQEQLNVLKSANQIEMTATQGLANAAKIESGKNLQFAAAKLSRGNAVRSAGGQLATAYAKKEAQTPTSDSGSNLSVTPSNAGADFTVTPDMFKLG
mgnify:FL=1